MVSCSLCALPSLLRCRNGEMLGGIIYSFDDTVIVLEMPQSTHDSKVRAIAPRACRRTGAVVQCFFPFAVHAVHEMLLL